MEGINFELVEVLGDGNRLCQHLQTGYVARKVSKARALAILDIIKGPQGQLFAFVVISIILPFIIGSSTQAEASIFQSG
jgi:hypothetical protein